MDRVNPTRACLVVLYIGAEKLPEYPAMDAMIKMTPFLFAPTSARVAMRVSLSGWLTLIWTAAYADSSVSSQKFDYDWCCKLAIEYSKRKNVHTASNTPAPAT
jgi:hypothetical protein